MSALGGNRLDKLHVSRLSAEQFTPPENWLTERSLTAAALWPAANVEQQHQRQYVTGSAVTAAAARFPIHIVRGSVGGIAEFAAGCVDNCAGDSTITIDLLLNGVSIATPIVLDSGDANYALVAGTLDDPDVELEADDVLEIDVTVSAGTGTLGKGLFVVLTTRDKPE